MTAHRGALNRGGAQGFRGRAVTGTGGAPGGESDIESPNGQSKPPLVPQGYTPSS